MLIIEREESISWVEVNCIHTSLSVTLRQCLYRTKYKTYFYKLEIDA